MTPLSALYASLPTMPNGQNPREIIDNLTRLGFKICRLNGLGGDDAPPSPVPVGREKIEQCGRVGALPPHIKFGSPEEAGYHYGRKDATDAILALLQDARS